MSHQSIGDEQNGILNDALVAKYQKEYQEKTYKELEALIEKEKITFKLKPNNTLKHAFDYKIFKNLRLTSLIDLDVRQELLVATFLEKKEIKVKFYAIYDFELTEKNLKRKVLSLEVVGEKLYDYGVNEALLKAHYGNLFSY